MGQQGNVLPLPAMSAGQPGMPGSGYGAQQGFDTTGQVAPPGMKPRVTATLWEDEGCLCLQVEAKGVCVARREGMSQCFNFVRNALTGNNRQ
jgi:enhanced filamentous growth protein 1